MKPSLRRVGTCQSPLVVVDGFSSGERQALIEDAAALAPFPPVRENSYPGLRRLILHADGAPFQRVTALLERAAPFIGGGFDAQGFQMLQASYSMVTTPPDRLTPPQRAPHFDSTDPRYLALLLYLTDTAGTAFYRQRATGIEQVNEANAARFVASARATPAPEPPGYIGASDDGYEQLDRVEGVTDRLTIYRGALLHSGMIEPGATFSDDPRRGRLTLNIFVRIN